jgi:hypothetical protein
MARIAPIPIWSGSCTDVNSLLVSAACHLTALIALAFAIAAGDAGSPGIQLSVDLSEIADMPTGDESPANDAVALQVVPDDAAAAVGPARLFDHSVLAVSDFGPLEAIAELAANESGLDGAALADFGDSTGGGLAGKASTDFFGIGGYGQSFVYVVDCSGSMSESGKFERAVYELLRSIEQLRSDQQYFVIFYNHQAYPMDSPGMVLATPKRFEETRDWISYAQPRGGTVPLPALLAALKIKPDAIFFLSDGLFDPQTSRVIRAYNRGKETRIPIHTIAFVNREAEGLMRTIARNSGGKYRFVK